MNSQYEIQMFTNELFGSVRSILDANGNPWFVGADVASCLGYEKTRNAIEAHVDPEDKQIININTALNQGGIPGNPNKVIINESGLYSLIFGSKLPAAKEFKHWVTSVVLPSMRRIGFYNAQQMLEQQIKFLQHQLAFAGEQSLHHSIENKDLLFCVYFILQNPYISDDIKKAMLNYDPTVFNPELDIKEETDKLINKLYTIKE